MKYFLQITIFFLFLTSVELTGQKSTHNTLIIKYESIQDISDSKWRSIKEITEHNPVFLQHYNQHINKGIESRLSTIFKIKTESDIPQWKLIEYLKKSLHTKYIEPYPEVHLLDSPNDVNIASQYYIPLMNMYEAWDITQGDSTTIIGIIDTGTDFTHEDLQGKVALNMNDTINGIDDDQDGFIDNYRGWDMAENNNNPQSDIDGHGVKVAGIAAASTNNALGIAGVGYNIHYLPIKVMNSEGELNTTYEGVVYAADHNCDVIVCAWGGTIESSFARDVIQYAVLDKDVVVVAAAGNSGDEAVYFPASYPEVISVAATNSIDHKWSSSTYGYTINISAPGEQIYATRLGNTYGSGSGTSYAAPSVGAIAALIRNQRPHLNAMQVALQMYNTSHPIDTVPQNVIYANKLGSGRIDAYHALADTLISGIAIEDISFLVNNTEDTVYLTCNITNYLQSSVIDITIESLSEYATPLVTEIQAGILNTSDIYLITGNSLPIVLSEEIPFDEPLPVLFKIDDGQQTYSRVAFYRANQSWKDIEFGKFHITIPSNGRLGFNNLSPVSGKGIRLENEDNVVWEAGLMYGNSSTQVVSSIYNDPALTILQGVNYLNNTDSLVTLQSIFSDESHASCMNVEVIQEVTTFNTEYLKQASILKYSFINNSNFDYSNFHVGLFFDWDLLSIHNIAYFDYENQIAVCKNISGESMFAGVTIIGSDFHQYAFALDENEGIDITDGFTTEERWFALSNNRPEAGDENGDDIAHLVSTQPMTFISGDTLDVFFIVALAHQESTIIDQINLAQNFLSEELSVTEHYKSNALIYPNPTSAGFNIDLINIDRVVITNAQGKIQNQSLTNGYIDTSAWSDGIYFIHITTKDKKHIYRKIIISN